jgi:lysozyme family protein
MKTVDQMIDDILRREGGYANHPADRGGPTNFGITQSTLATYRREYASEADVKSMSKTEARAIYRQIYYLDPHLDLLPPDLQPFVFDCAVNHGPTQASRFVQEVCNQLDSRKIGVDGKLGPVSCGRARELLVNVGYDTLMRALVERRRQFYLDLIKRRPDQEAFRKGWMNRLAEFAVDHEQKTLILTGVELPKPKMIGKDYAMDALVVLAEFQLFGKKILVCTPS